MTHQYNNENMVDLRLDTNCKPLFKNTPNKGHNTCKGQVVWSLQDQFYLLKRTSVIITPLAGPIVCIIHQDDTQCLYISNSLLHETIGIIIPISCDPSNGLSLSLVFL